MNYLGIELGSTRIKAVKINDNYKSVSSGDYVWQSKYENGIWTYDLEEAFKGVKSAVSQIENSEDIAAVGISGMMHGYLAFDKDWNLLVTFRTWQNTITADSADILTKLFNFNIPQRWSIAHLYQAVLNNEEHVKNIAHITTLAGYVNYRLTGVNAIGIGEASGMFPIDPETNTYDEEMLQKFEKLTENQPWNARELLPKVLVAGENAGQITEQGAMLLENLIPAGVPVAPPEGDAGTGMVTTNSVAESTGNVSAGTSIFSMIVLNKPLHNLHQEIDIVTTPAGKPVAMVHCNNCSNDLNAWVRVLGEVAELFGNEFSSSELYEKLYKKSLEGDADCSGVITYNYLAGEGITKFDEGRPIVMRSAESKFNLANFIRSQLYATISTLKIGMDILTDEGVKVEKLTGHGGLFKTPIVYQKYMAGAFNTPITCMESAGEGGPYGMALLAAYMINKKNETLEEFLNEQVFASVRSVTLNPEKEDAEGFNRYVEQFENGLPVEKAAIERT